MVWGNGVVASTAVGLAIKLLANWTRRPRCYTYLAHGGNLGTVDVHPRIEQRLEVRRDRQRMDRFDLRPCPRLLHGIPTKSQVF